MHDYSGGLENRIINKTCPAYKSAGERKIAYFLDRNNIRYLYEPAILVRNSSDGKPMIWYPDFYLQEFKTYLEYYGMAGNRSYDMGIKAKQSTYRMAGLDLIAIYPWMFREYWQGHIIHELERAALSRFRNLMEKPYWSKTNGSYRTYQKHTGHGRRNLKRY